MSRTKMKSDILKSMSTDELWKLHQSVVTLLARKIEAERAILEARLQKLSAATGIGQNHERSAYPKVAPKYSNPQNRKETWAGRGKLPRWLTAQLRSGRKLDDFLIRRTSA
jgi:DNA-binding protein H-NS